MQKTVLLATVFFLLVGLVPGSVHAQMMGGRPVASPEVVTQTTQDEAEGKAVWEKLQSKQATCSELTDDDFDVLGDFFMGSMMGVNHASMNQQIATRLGDDGEKQMHITMGKRLSGCDTNAAFPQGGSYFAPMMGFGGGMMGGTTTNSWGGRGYGMMGIGATSVSQNDFGKMFLVAHVIGGLTWLALIAFLLTGTVFFWKETHRRK